MGGLCIKSTQHGQKVADVEAFNEPLNPHVAWDGEIGGDSTPAKQGGDTSTTDGITSVRIERTSSRGEPSWNAAFSELRKSVYQEVKSHETNSAESILMRASRIEIKHQVASDVDPQEKEAAKALLQCLDIRRKYVGPSTGPHVEAPTISFETKEESKIEYSNLFSQFDGDAYLSKKGNFQIIRWSPYKSTPPSKDDSLNIVCDSGVFVAQGLEKSTSRIDVTEFCQDYVKVLQTMRDRTCISFCGPRLQELELKYQLHQHLNAAHESRQQKASGGRDWFQVRKVDTHIHHSACFSQKQLMQFIRKKMKTEMDTKVALVDGKELSLREVFCQAGVKEDDVNADQLCCMASIAVGGTFDTFGRFDRFNSKYNPFGDKRLRDIFLKTDNYIDGRFLAELTKDVMEQHRKNKFVMAEWRISIYGRNHDEWGKLARWFRKYDIQCPQVRWLVQVPRLYALFKKLGSVTNFADMLHNIFEPLFHASVDPAGHEDIFYMLQQVVGFDSVDDESQGTHMTLDEYPSPEEWDIGTNPPYTYWMYYMYANIRSLNNLRSRRGLNTFVFRPHCGEAGNVSHLCSGFMLTDGICHGVQLRENVVLQYLFYLAQIGIAVSPLSNDILFIPLAESPFPSFFKRGLNVSLSTDDPLIIHLTDTALIEEYLVAARSFQLSLCDLCEIARNSVLQSGFEHAFKTWWVGETDLTPGSARALDKALPEDMEMALEKSNVPSIRLLFRDRCIRDEFEHVHSSACDGT